MRNKTIYNIRTKTLSLLAGCLMLCGAGTYAQEGRYRYDDATQLWRLTDNAAGLSADSLRNRGRAEFLFEHRDGDYHRVQEGGMRNLLQFNTERYQTIGKHLVGYGRFTFDMDRTQDRAWCDVMRPYNANPFFSGSSIAGKYDTQQFDLTAAVGTVTLNGWRLGARLDYQVGDMSRLRDPRSRSQLLDYRLTPAVSYTTGPHTVGLSGSYERRKEKMPSLTTVQEDPNLMYYVMTGMEQATGTVGGYKGFSREWVDHRFKAELSYGLKSGSLNSLTTVSIARGTEDAWGTYKYEPGKYVSYEYGFATRNRIGNGRQLHQLDLSLSYMEGYADEYRQQLVQERDADNGYTSYHYTTLIEYKKRYQAKVFQADFSYRLNWLDGKAITQYVGMGAKAQTVSNKHLLPTSSLAYGFADFTLEGGRAVLDRRLWVEVLAGYHRSTKADLSLADAGNDYAREVFVPDQCYYGADYWRGRLQLTYEFPLTIKGTPSLWYVRGYCERLSAQQSMNRNTFGIAIGIFN